LSGAPSPPAVYVDLFDSALGCSTDGKAAFLVISLITAMNDLPKR